MPMVHRQKNGRLVSDCDAAANHFMIHNASDNDLGSLADAETYAELPVCDHREQLGL